MQEVSGSIPLISTKMKPRFRKEAGFLLCPEIESWRFPGVRQGRGGGPDFARTHLQGSPKENRLSFFMDAAREESGDRRFCVFAVTPGNGCQYFLRDIQGCCALGSASSPMISQSAQIFDKQLI